MSFPFRPRLFVALLVACLIGGFVLHMCRMSAKLSPVEDQFVGTWKALDADETVRFNPDRGMSVIRRPKNLDADLFGPGSGANVWAANNSWLAADYVIGRVSFGSGRATSTSVTTPQHLSYRFSEDGNHLTLTVNGRGRMFARVPN